MLGEKEIKELFDLLEKFKTHSPLNANHFDEIGKEKPFFFLADNMSHDSYQLGIENAQLERPAGRN